IRAPKVYEGEIRLGIATDTYDASGQVLSEAPAEALAALTREAVAEARRRVEGEIEQKPPPYSAKKINGVKYYELARRGEEVPDEPKEVTVYGFELVKALTTDGIGATSAAERATPDAGAGLAPALSPASGGATATAL